jgi:molybdopterin molybdotransferase
MITFEEALLILEANAGTLQVEEVGLTECLGRVLAEDVFSDMDMPPFDKSAVDGYACRRDDLGKELVVLEIIAAGQVPKFRIGPGECAKLMTGGMVPEGADTVIMIEDVESALGESIRTEVHLNTVSGSSEGKRIRFRGKTTNSNICYQSEDLKKGSQVLDKGALIRPQEIAVLASVGKSLPLVYKQAHIGIITTGDELVEPNQVPGLSQIRNSNAWQLIGQAQQAGCQPTYYGIAVDNEEQTAQLIEKASEENDIVILTGGISVGDFDFVPAVLKKAGFDIKFRSLAVQPGKPSIFATRGSTRLFALPGNPVSSFVQFEMMVKFMLKLMTSNNSMEKTIRLPLGFDYSRKRTDRKAFMPVVLSSEGTAASIEYHGSAHIQSYIHADGIISIEIGQNEIKKGTLVDVRLL